MLSVAVETKAVTCVTHAFGSDLDENQYGPFRRYLSSSSVSLEPLLKTTTNSVETGRLSKSVKKPKQLIAGVRLECFRICVSIRFVLFVSWTAVEGPVQCNGPQLEETRVQDAVNFLSESVSQSTSDAEAANLGNGGTIGDRGADYPKNRRSTFFIESTPPRGHVSGTSTITLAGVISPSQDEICPAKTPRPCRSDLQQYCPHGETLRNARHHKIKSEIAQAFCHKGYTTYEEIHGLSETGSCRRVDILAFNKTTGNTGCLKNMGHNFRSLPSKETLRGRSDSSFRGEGYIQYLDRRFPDRWIGRGGPIAWPPRSPDLNPLDFYLWGHLKSLVYSSPMPDLESLRNRIVACSEDIRNTPGVWDRVRRSMRHRCEVCIQAGGGHFEHIL
ncbi:hypothetical protein ANN_03553 [Periplaneta americana]|uniref:Uncharacterized protein n=1 Tax=Periplaneta americana TaxID=6978 RepID=A0ABQ8TZ91_PERAM|nr:hypothetical protein ANN_03553 [Periplaneta americana]